MKKILSVILSVALIFSMSVHAEEKKEKEPSFILIEQSSGRVLYEKNADEKRAPASVTKIMTALLVMEQIDSGKMKLSDMVVASEHASAMGGTQIYLEVGERMSIEDLLKGLMVVSGNDTAVALAEHVGGTEKKFVEMMNKKAKDLGLKNTHYVNCNGLPEEGHYSCARDIAVISRELLLKHPAITKYTTIWMDYLRNGKFQLANTNKLVSYYKGITGLKTGYTSEAKNCLSASATRGKLNFISVVMGIENSNQRFKESEKLLDYGFDNYEILREYSEGEVMKKVPVKRGRPSEIEAACKEDFTIIRKKGQKDELIEEYNISDLKAPVKKGQKIGTVTFKLGKEEVGTLELVSNKDVRKMHFFDYFSGLFSAFKGM